MVNYKVQSWADKRMRLEKVKSMTYGQIILKTLVSTKSSKLISDEPVQYLDG